MNTEPDPPAIVTVSEPAVVVNTIPAPDANVNVSAVESATTFDCPDTEIVPNALAPTAVFVNVIVSEPAAVVIASPVPPTNVNVSDELSATTSDCPDTEIVSKALPPARPQLNVPEPSVFNAYPEVPSAAGNTQI